MQRLIISTRFQEFLDRSELGQDKKALEIWGENPSYGKVQSWEHSLSNYSVFFRVIHDFGKVENSNASQLFESLLGEEAQNKKNESLIGGHSMVSNGLFGRTF